MVYHVWSILNGGYHEEKTYFYFSIMINDKFPDFCLRRKITREKKG